jgi:hypothetical protein
MKKQDESASVVTLKSTSLGVLLLLNALQCNALGLGRAQGVVWIGQPLDVTVRVRLEGPEDSATLCPEADVFEGDRRVDPGRVRATVEPGPDPREPLVRIRSSSLVEEPVVTVFLNAGCSNKSTRRYVLLAEPQPVDLPSVSDRTPTVASTSARRAAAPSVEVAANAVASAPVLPVRSESRRASVPKITRSAGPALPQMQVRAAPQGKARLQIDPAEFFLERDPVLRLSGQLLTVPAEADPRRAELAAQWRALNASPETILRAEQQLASLQSGLASAQEKGRQQQATVAELKAQLDRIRSERSTANVLVYLLAGLLVLSAAAAAFFWRRSQTTAGNQWWSLDDKSVAGAAAASGDAKPAASAISTAQKTARDEPTVAVPAVAVGKQERRAAVSSLLEDSDFEISFANSTRAVKVEELFDVQQEADFFISLGQFDQAVAVLRNHISENAETSALAYLDLLGIYHLQGRKDEYDLVRTEFNRAFNAQVPAFGDFDRQGRGLEAYGAALTRITSLWPTPRVLDVIEESIFRKPGAGTPAFDLEAYRELLLLYAVAKDIVESAPSKEPPAKADAAPNWDAFSEKPSKFQSTNIQPLQATLESAPSLNVDLRVPASPNLGLDIDLSEFSESHAGLGAMFSPPPVPTSTAKPVDPPESHMIDFDLFDKATAGLDSKKRL